MVATHESPVPAGGRPALPPELGPPRARATPRPSPAGTGRRHAPRDCHAERQLTTGVADHRIGDAAGHVVCYPLRANVSHVGQFRRQLTDRATSELLRMMRSTGTPGPC